MGIWGWLSNNTFSLINAFGVIASLLFTAVSLRSETKTRRIANLVAITGNHRELWKTFLEDQRLARVRSATVDLGQHPVTEAEKVFVGMVIHHVHSVFNAMSDQLVVPVEGLRRDIAQFFALPIPRQVWEVLKPLQNDEFIVFVEDCLSRTK